MVNTLLGISDTSLSIQSPELVLKTTKKYGKKYTKLQNTIKIIIRSHRQQRSIASTQSAHDDEPWTILHECWRVYHRRSAGSMNGTGVLAVAANQDQSGGQFLLLRPVIMCGGLACGHRVSAHGRTMNLVSWRYPEHREGWSGLQLLCFWQSHASVSRGSYVRNACGRPRASVDLPAEVSIFPNRTTKWIVYKSGTGEVLSAVEAGYTARL